MTLPTLIVDPPQLTSASSALSASAGNIPTELPKFSVAGDDPLSAAISAGAVDVESPMLALPAIKAKATTTAQNIGSAAQQYTATDQAFAARVRQSEFTAASNGIGHTGGSGRFKTATGVGRDLPPLTPADPGPTPSPSPSPSPGPSPTPAPPPSGAMKPMTPGDLTPAGPIGDVTEKSAEQAGKHASGRMGDALKDVKRFGKGFSFAGNIGQLWQAGNEINDLMNHGQPGGKSFKYAAIEVLPKTFGNILGSTAGTSIGAANGAVGGANFGGEFGKKLRIPFGETVGKALGGIAGAGVGAFGGGSLGGHWGEGIGKSLSGTLHQWFPG